MKMRNLIVVAAGSPERYIRSNRQRGGRERAIAALQCCALLLLALSVSPKTLAQTNAGSTTASRYITALQKSDLKTVIDLSYDYQGEISKIKAQNPQVLWPKLTKEYYDAKIAALSKKPGFMGAYLQGMMSDPAQQIQFMQNVVLPNAKWKVTETRTEHVRDQFDGHEYDRTIVYITVTFPTVNDSPFLDGKFLKETILEVDLNAKVQQVIAAGRLAQGDTAWDAPIMIMNAKWSREGLAGMGHLTAEGFGGKPPYAWKPVCGPYDLSRNVVDQPAEPQGPASLVVDLQRFPTNVAFPLHCSLSVTDGSGQSDAVGITVSQMLSGVSEFCYVREPWFSRGQGRPGQSNMCLDPIKATDAASASVASAEPLAPLPSASDTPLPGIPSNVQPSACGDYDGCMGAGRQASAARDWNGASTDFQAAAQQRPASGDPWVGLGRALLLDGRSHQLEDLARPWDRALALGATIVIPACHERTMQPCERGDLSLSKSSVAFLTRGTEPVFSTPPSGIEPGRILNNPGAAHVSYGFKAAGKNYAVDFFPPGVQCTVNLMVQCPPDGIAKQLLIAEYVSQALPKLASGAYAILGVSVSDFCKLPIAVTSLEDKITDSRVSTPPSMCPNGQSHFL